MVKKRKSGRRPLFDIPDPSIIRYRSRNRSRDARVRGRNRSRNHRRRSRSLRQSALRLSPRARPSCRHLREQILRGDFPAGSMLPTEQQLCSRFDVSRQTVRAALELVLAENGAE